MYEIRGWRGRKRHGCFNRSALGSQQRQQGGLIGLLRIDRVLDCVQLPTELSSESESTSVCSVCGTVQNN